MLLLPRNVFQFFPWVIDCWFRKFPKIRAVRDYFQQLPLSHPQDNISSVLTKNDLKPRGCKITSFLQHLFPLRARIGFWNFRWLTNHDKKSCKLISLCFGPKFLVANSGWHLRIIRMLWMEFAPRCLVSCCIFQRRHAILSIYLSSFFFLPIDLPAYLYLGMGSSCSGPKTSYRYKVVLQRFWPIWSLGLQRCKSVSVSQGQHDPNSCPIAPCHEMESSTCRKCVQQCAWMLTFNKLWWTEIAGVEYEGKSLGSSTFRSIT